MFISKSDGKVLKKYRERNNLTIEEAAQKSNVLLSRLEKFEKPTKKDCGTYWEVIMQNELEKLLSLYGISESYFIQDCIVSC